MNTLSSLLNFIGNRFKRIQGGETTIGAVTTKSYVDKPITFPNTYTETPKVVVCLNSASTGAGMGNVTVSAINVTTSGFTIRVFNNDTADRSPAVRWIAIP